MKIPVILAMVVTASGTASARNVDIPTGPVVRVCTDVITPIMTLSQARGLASRMFATAGVTIEWRAWNSCPADAIRISLYQSSLASDHPHAYAYAQPYEGSHIVLFWDRIVASTGPRALPYLTAHVLVHEITHILQGICRHSETGVMKAAFTQEDIGHMEFRSLSFTAEDLDLIQRGIAIREARRN